MICSHHFDILNNCINEHVFLNEVWWDNETCTRAEELHAICMPCSLLPYLHTPFTMPQEYKLPVDPQWHGSSGRLNARQVWACYIYHWVSRGADSSKRPFNLFKSNLLWTQKEGNGILRNANNQGTLSYPFLLMSRPYIQPFMLKGWYRKKEKDRANQFPFVLPASYKL